MLTLSATFTSGELFIEERFQVNETHRVIISCDIAEPRNRAERRVLRARGGRVRKQRTLLFKLVDTNVPEPFEVYWKVRNRGQEARDRGALRGQITRDDGARQKRESTLYTGHHYVECYIVKNGICVARAYEPVNISP